MIAKTKKDTKNGTKDPKQGMRRLPRLNKLSSANIQMMSLSCLISPTFIVILICKT